MRDLEWKADDGWKRKEAEWLDLVQSFPEEDRELVLGLVGQVKSEIDLFRDKTTCHQMRLFFLILRRGLTLSSLRIGDALKYSGLSGDYSSRFFRIAGMRPLEFLNYHRSRLAQEILRHVDLPKYIVAYVVGLPDQSVLCRIYKKFIGYRPSDEPRADQGHTRELLEQFKNPIDTLDPRVSENTAEMSIDPADTNLAGFWAQAKKLEHSKLKDYLVSLMPSIGIEHFHLLLEKSKYEGRKDRARGEELALCALDVIRLVEIRRGEFYFDEMALGCATVGNACRLQLKFDEASRWFQRADVFLPSSSKEAKPLLCANVDLLRGSLLWWRREVEAALGLVKRVLPVVREHASYHLLARALLLTADIYDSSGHSDRAIPLLAEALELTQFIDDDYIVFGAHYNLTYHYVRSGKAAEATAQFREVQKFYGTVGDIQVAPCLVGYLSAVVAFLNGSRDEAVVLFLEARDDFLKLGLDIFAALTSLHLALVYLEDEKNELAAEVAISAIPAIARFGAHQDAVAALALIQEAEDRGFANRSVLKKAISHLELVRKDPTGNFMCEI